MRQLHYDPERKWVLIFSKDKDAYIVITRDGIQNISTDPKKMILE